jgi:hypothetical protein
MHTRVLTWKCSLIRLFDGLLKYWSASAVKSLVSWLSASLTFFHVTSPFRFITLIHRVSASTTQRHYDTLIFQTRLSYFLPLERFCHHMPYIDTRRLDWKMFVNVLPAIRSLPVFWIIGSSVSSLSIVTSLPHWMILAMIHYNTSTRVDTPKGWDHGM